MPRKKLNEYYNTFKKDRPRIITDHGEDQVRHLFEKVYARIMLTDEDQYIVEDIVDEIKAVLKDSTVVILNAEKIIAEMVNYLMQDKGFVVAGPDFLRAGVKKLIWPMLNRIKTEEPLDHDEFIDSIMIHFMMDISSTERITFNISTMDAYSDIPLETINDIIDAVYNYYVEQGFIQSDQDEDIQGSVDNSSVDLAVKFHDCNAGRIHMDFRAGKESIHVRMSHHYDPFEDMLSWMAAIVLKEPVCTWIINEETYYKMFTLSQRGADTATLVIDQYCQGEAIDKSIKVTVSTFELVSVIYSAFIDFTESPDYIPIEWEMETILDRLMRKSGMDENEVVEQLSALSQQMLEDLFFFIAPSSSVEHPGIEGTGEKTSISSEPTITPESEDTPGMIKKPDKWEVDYAYNSWTITVRKAYIIDYIKKNANPYCGAKLGELGSTLIEQYIDY